MMMAMLRDLEGLANWSVPPLFALQDLSDSRSAFPSSQQAHIRLHKKQDPDGHSGKGCHHPDV